jgi:hypothetical protein
MQQWLLENALTLVGFLVVGIIMLHRATAKVAAVDERLCDHLNSAMPHPGCPSHDTMLHAIQHSLDELKEQVTRLDGRLYGFIKNGYRSHD